MNEKIEFNALNDITAQEEEESKKKIQHPMNIHLSY